MLSIWRIPAAAAAGWVDYHGQRRESRSAVSACETSCGRMGLRAIYQEAHAPTVPVDFHREALSPAWWTSRRSRKVDQVWQRISRYIALRKGLSSTLVLVVDLFSTACTTLENSRAALDTEFCLRPWRWLLCCGESHSLHYRSGVSARFSSGRRKTPSIHSRGFGK